MANPELLLEIYNNENPTQINWENANYFGWKTFAGFLQRRDDPAKGKIVINDADWNTMNSTDPNKKTQRNELSLIYINYFNKEWLPNNFTSSLFISNEEAISSYKITTANIVAVQAFTKVVSQPINPNTNAPVTIYVDGWLGSQTSRMRYPDIGIAYTGPATEILSQNVSPTQVPQILKAYQTKYKLTGNAANYPYKTIHTPVIVETVNNVKQYSYPGNNDGYYGIKWGKMRFVIKGVILFNLLYNYNNYFGIKDDPNDISKNSWYQSMTIRERILYYNNPDKLKSLNLEWDQNFVPVPKWWADISLYNQGTGANSKNKIPAYGPYYGLEIYDPDMHKKLIVTPVGWEKDVIIYNPNDRQLVINAINDYNSRIKRGDSTYINVQTMINTTP